MNVEYIKTLASQALQSTEVTLQVNQGGQQLSIVINRPKDLEVDYEGLASKILAFLIDNLTSEDLTGVESIKFFGRIKGQTKQEWQKIEKLDVPARNSVETSEQTPNVIALGVSPSAFVPKQHQTNQKPSNDTEAVLFSAKNKFGGLFAVARDLIGVGALIGIFMVLLINFFAERERNSQSVEWEYRIEAVSDSIFTASMNIYGKEGWELVTARRALSGDTASYECIFKRVKRK